MRFSTFGLTHKGMVRSKNEDSLFVDDSMRIYAVADGLGGLPRGSLASTLAIETLKEELNDLNNTKSLDYKTIFNQINEKVHAEGKKISEEVGIGTTLTVVKLNVKDMHIGHVGDCSVFLCRQDALYQLTTDHTMEEEIRSRLQPGEDACIPEYFTHTLTRCIGQQGEVEADVYNQDIAAGDRILICSDGITKTMSEDDILREIKAINSPEKFVNRIIEIANEEGGPDNSTGIAIYVN